MSACYPRPPSVRALTRCVWKPLRGPGVTAMKATETLALLVQIVKVRALLSIKVLCNDRSEFRGGSRGNFIKKGNTLRARVPKFGTV